MRDRIGYLHVPKAAGSSVTDAIRRAVIGTAEREQRTVSICPQVMDRTLYGDFDRYDELQGKPRLEDYFAGYPGTQNTARRCRVEAANAILYQATEDVQWNTRKPTAEDLKRIRDRISHPVPKQTRWVSKRLRQVLRGEWPENYFRLFGSLASSDLERPTQPDPAADAPRESLD